MLPRRRDADLAATDPVSRLTEAVILRSTPAGDRIHIAQTLTRKSRQRIDLHFSGQQGAPRPPGQAAGDGVPDMTHAFAGRHTARGFGRLARVVGWVAEKRTFGTLMCAFRQPTEKVLPRSPADVHPHPRP